LQTLAQVLLTLAERDEQAYRKLAEVLDLHDSLAGFHGQQAVEKALKAVLARAGVVFRRTHDIAELLDLIEDSRGLRASDILIDVTGGQKPTSIAGAAVALAEGRCIQYVSTRDYRVRVYDVTYGE
jgi:hypothetical protein